jgi:(2Fe-2S) ferredoxin
LTPFRKTNEELRAIAKELGLGKAVRHIFLCTGPDCCDREEGLASWKHLKARIKDLGLDRGPTPVLRSKADCLRVCGGGPIAVVYPEGVWYGNMTPEGLDRVIEDHLAGGRPCDDCRFDPPDDAREPM